MLSRLLIYFFGTGTLRKQFIFSWYLCCVVFVFVLYRMLSFTICVFMLRHFSYRPLDCWLSTLINNWIDLNWNNRSLKTSSWTFGRSLHSLQVDSRSVKATCVLCLNLWTLIFRTENQSRVLLNSLRVPHRLICKEAVFYGKEQSKLFILAHFQSRSR